MELVRVPNVCQTGIIPTVRRRQSPRIAQYACENEDDQQNKYRFSTEDLRIALMVPQKIYIKLHIHEVKARLGGIVHSWAPEICVLLTCAALGATESPWGAARRILGRSPRSTRFIATQRWDRIHHGLKLDKFKPCFLIIAYCRTFIHPST